MSSTIRMQRPSGGCECCGGTVRTHKPEGWVCTRCIREGRHLLPAARQK